jgi:hypothetical protein
MVVREKPRRAAISEILDTAHMAPMIIGHSKSLRMGKMSDLTLNQTLTVFLDACLPALYSKARPRDSLPVGVIHLHEWGGVPNKLDPECISAAEDSWTGTQRFSMKDDRQE